MLALKAKHGTRCAGEDFRGEWVRERNFAPEVARDPIIVNPGLNPRATRYDSVAASLSVSASPVDSTGRVCRSTM